MNFSAVTETSSMAPAIQRYVLFALLCAPSFALANGNDSFCYPLTELAEKVRNCGHNQAFAKAANLCLEKIEKETSAQQAILAQAMMLNTAAAAASSQGGRMENNIQNLTAMRATLENLISQARKARQEVVQYSEHFVYAGPVSQDLATRLNLHKILRKFECHRLPLGELVTVVEKIDEKVKELRTSRDSALALEARTAANKKTVDSTSLTQKASGTRTPASASAPAGGPKPAAKQKASNITGEIKDSNRELQKVTK